MAWAFLPRWPTVGQHGAEFAAAQEAASPAGPDITPVGMSAWSAPARYLIAGCSTPVPHPRSRTLRSLSR